METIKLLGIVPYEGLKDLLIDIGSTRADLEITAYHADLELGAQLVRQLDASEYDVILSRGGTARLIREISPIPVIEIALSHQDILNVIKLAEQHGGKCAIVGFPNICKMAKDLCAVLERSITIVEIERSTEVPAVIAKLIKEGYTITIGDVVSCVQAQKQGLASLLITSARESVLAAVDAAVLFARHVAQVKLQNQLFNHASRLNGGGVLIFKEGNLLFCNLPKHRDIYLEMVRKMQVFVSEKKHYVLIQPVEKNNMKCSGYLKEIAGESYHFYLIEQIGRREQPMIPGVYTILNEDISSSFFNLDFSYDTKQELQQEMAQIHKSPLPVLVIGESGTGKERVAKTLFQNGMFSQNPCYCINFSELQSKGFATLLESTNSCLLSNESTIYFKNLQLLSEEKLQRLLAFIESSQLQRRNRIIVSITVNLSDLHQLSAYRQLNSLMPCLSIKLPPLRERAEDIPELLSVFLNEINATRGLNILGCEAEGVKLLQNFTWEHNLGQLKAILSALVAMAQGPYILANDVRHVLGEESRKAPKMPGGTMQISLNQSLEKMTQEIAFAVLQEESMNQTKAAKRLGISRTTLWRMMQSEG